MNRLLQGWKSLDGRTRLVMLAIVAGVLIVVGVSVGGAVSHIKDNAFARRESQRESERQQLQRERDAAIGRAEAAEARERELESKAAAQEAAISAAGSKAEAAAKSLEEEARRYDEEMANANLPASDDVRRRRICERLHKLYPGAKCKE